MARAASSPFQPRQYQPQPCDANWLPFVAKNTLPRAENIWNYWNVKPTANYYIDAIQGMAYAGHYLQYVKDNARHLHGGPDSVLRHIVEDMARTYRFGKGGDTLGDDEHGHVDGFVSVLEAIIKVVVLERDPFQFAARVAQDLQREFGNLAGAPVEVAHV